jgi:hypothetical protein
MKGTPVEYLVVEVRYVGSLGQTMTSLEDELDNRAKMNWCLHTITYLELAADVLHAVLIYERTING